MVGSDYIWNIQNWLLAKKVFMKRILRNLLLAARKGLLRIENRYDKLYLVNNVPTPKIVSHNNWKKYLVEIGNKPGMRILEIGSREVTGKSTARQELALA